jgi:dTDP-4-dehydrorhamnose reductase
VRDAQPYALRMRTLVTGSAGFIGSWVLRSLREHGIDALAGVRAGAHHASAEEAVAIDLALPHTLAAALDACAPECIIHCAAMRDLGQCERERAAATTVNFEATRAIARWCGLRGARLFFLSTDQVFDGTRAMSREEDPRRPINHYGVTKALAEESVWAADGTVVRVTLTLGLTREGNRSPNDHVVAALRAGQPVTLFADEERSPILVDDVAEGLVRLALRTPQARCYHLAGAERIDRYRLGLEIARRFGLDEKLCRSALSSQTPTSVARPLLCSLDSTRLARELDWRPRPLAQALAYLHAQSSRGG